MSEHIKIICDGCKENLQPIFNRGDSFLELKIFADSNYSQEISKLEGTYHFCDLDCLKIWKHLPSTSKRNI